MIRSAPAWLTAALLLASLTPARAAETGTLSLEVPVYRTKTKGDAIKYAPFKSTKAPFVVTVALFDGQTGEPLLLDDGLTPWTESFTVTTKDAAPSNPATGDLREPAPIKGFASVVLGSSVALPPDLTEREVLYTTQLALIKKGEVQAPFEESPRRPLGLDGAVTGQALAPARVTTEALTLTTGAAAGLVLTSDAAGNGSWKELPDLPGVDGTANRIAVFDSANSLGDSNLRDNGGNVSVDVPLFVNGDITGTDLVASGDVYADDDVQVLDDLMVGDSGSFGGTLAVNGAITGASLSLAGDVAVNDVIASGRVQTGTPSVFAPSSGDVAATDDLIADDDLFVGDNVTVNGSVSIGESLSASTGSFSSTLVTQGSVTSTSGSLVTGTPSTSFGSGDIAATSNLVADLDVTAGDDVIVGDQLTVGDRINVGSATATGVGDVALSDDLTVGDDAIIGGQLDVLGTFISNLSATNSELQLRSNGDQVFIRDFNFGDSGLVDETLWFDGPAGLGGDLEMRLDSGGGLSIDGQLSSGGADLAEWFPTADDGLEPGTLVALDPTRAEHVLRAEFGRHEVLLGVVPTAPGVLLGGGDIMGPQPDLLRASLVAGEQGDVALARELRAAWRASVDDQAGRVAVALEGRVPVRVDLTGGRILPGDRVGLSAQAGVAARYTGYGPVLGLAMEGYDGSGDGTIVVFLDLDHSPDAASAGSAGATALLDGLDRLAQDALLRGQGVIEPGQRQVLVRDERLGQGSLPVVSFYGNPGGASWIGERGAGWFVLELEHPASVRLEFGFTASP